MRRIASLAVVVFVAGVAALTAAPQVTKHPFAIRDLVMLSRISEPAASPDGEWIVFTLRKTDLDANRGRTDLYLVKADGSGFRQLTTHEANDSNPIWAPDGRAIYFLSTRSGSSQVWKLSLDGGEPSRATDLPLDVSNLVLSPDGKTFAFSLEVFPDCGSDLACTGKRHADREKSKATGRIYDALFIRHWDTWSDGTRNHLFTMPVAGGKPVDVMAGMDADAPSKPFGGSEELTFTPDGKSLVFAARNVGRSEAWSTNLDLFVAPIDGAKAPRDLTSKNEATDTQPVFSPDGKTLAYLAMKRPGFEADRLRIVLRDGLDGAERVLTEAWDRSPESIRWSKDGKTIYTTAEDTAQTNLEAIDVATGRPTPIVGNGSCHDPMLLAGGRIGFGRDTIVSPVDLFTVRGDGSDERQITAVNADAMSQVSLGAPEQMNFKGWNNETVWAYVVKPVDFDPAKKYPVALLIHGGPQGSFENNFHYRWNPEVYAGHGYAVVEVDFHGSTGYGQAFTDAIRDDWGGKPLVDLQKGLEAALKSYPWMDGTKVSALGGSYGGYMVNWIAGAWPERFRCLVSHDGNLDERFAYFATEELWFPEWEHKGTPWTNPQGYEKQNPLALVAKWKTPILVVHGAHDYRIVDSEGIATFTAAQRMGIPSKLLYFPDENHWVLKPQDSILWYDTVLAWLDRWTAGDAEKK